MFTFVLAWVLTLIVHELGPSGAMDYNFLKNVLFASILEIYLVAYTEKWAFKKWSYFFKGRP